MRFNVGVKYLFVNVLLIQPGFFVNFLSTKKEFINLIFIVRNAPKITREQIVDWKHFDNVDLLWQPHFHVIKCTMFIMHQLQLKITVPINVPQQNMDWRGPKKKMATDIIVIQLAWVRRKLMGYFIKRCVPLSHRNWFKYISENSQLVFTFMKL